jgi:hypothetical protein
MSVSGTTSDNRLSTGSTSVPFEHRAYRETGNSANNVGLYRYVAAVSNGATGSQNLAATDTHSSWVNGDFTTLLSLKGNGDLISANDLTATRYVRHAGVIYAQYAANANYEYMTSGFVPAHPFTALISAASCFRVTALLSNSTFSQTNFSTGSTATPFSFTALRQAGNALDTAGHFLYKVGVSNGSTGAQNIIGSHTHSSWINFDGSSLMALKGNGDLNIAGQLTGLTHQRAITGSTGSTAADQGKFILYNSASDGTYTIDDTQFTIGATINFMNWVAGGLLTIACSASVTSPPSQTLKLKESLAVATAYKQGAGSWILFGNLEAV